MNEIVTLVILLFIAINVFKVDAELFIVRVLKHIYTLIYKLCLCEKIKNLISINHLLGWHSVVLVAPRGSEMDKHSALFRLKSIVAKRDLVRHEES